MFFSDPEMTNSTSLLLKHLPDVCGKSVLDIGTGTGILAIYAAQHGAARVTAVDVDQDALTNAAENVTSHGFDVHRKQVWCRVFFVCPKQQKVTPLQRKQELQSRHFFSGHTNARIVQVLEN
jgi:methylase of polypeptide subunit release factors